MIAAGSPPPAPTSPDRPISVTVVGWVWVVVGALRTMGSGIALAAWRLGGLREIFTGSSPLAAFLPAPILRLAFRHFGAGLVLQLASGVLFLCAGLGLLRLRPWARTAIRIFCWLGLAFVTLFAAGWLFLWLSAAPAASVDPSTRGIVAGATLFLCGALIWAFAAMIQALGRAEVRSAFSRS